MANIIIISNEKTIEIIFDGKKKFSMLSTI